MVSTRGVKFKFSVGEKVLCYEPDSSKAKVLYDSKVLKLVVNCDSHGRKIPEYLIHFFGWNNSWNRCVVEGFILPDNEENRNLQKKLAEDAAIQLKGKNKRKPPPIFKETLSIKKCKEGKKEMDDLRQMDSPDYPSESELSEDDMERTAEIEIPQPLKEQLEEDRCYITRKNKIVKIPCEPNVVSILESYIKHLAANLLCAAPPKNTKIRSEPFIPEDVESKLDFCKEVLDGIRVYFDFTLPHLLLYQQEQKQYYTVGTVCKPICGVKRESQKIANENPANDAKVISATTVTDSGSQLEQDTTSKACIATSPPSTAVTPPAIRGRPSLRNSSHTSKPESPNEETSINGTAITPKGKGSSHLQLSKEKKERMSGIKRILRSNDKQKENSSTVATDSSKKNNPETDSCLQRPESPILSCSPSRHGRGTSKNVLGDPLQSATYSSDAQLSSTGHCPINNSNAAAPFAVVSSSSQNIYPPPPLNLSVTNSICSSASSTRSSLSSPRFDYPPYQPLNASGMLSEILSWNMLPPYVYEQVPAPPSLIYGAQHLLRLFVKLPDLIYKMNIPRKKLVPLMNNLADFLNYLSEKREETFLPSAYVDANETLMEQNSHVST